MKKLLPLLAIFLIGLGLWFWMQRGSTEAEEGQLTLYGNIDIRQVALAFNASGRITALEAREGDSVEAGAVLGAVDTKQLELQAQAQAALVEAQRQSLQELELGARPEELAQARAVLASAEASAKVAQSEYDRVAQMIASKSAAATQQSFEQAAANLTKANALVDQSRAALALLEAGARRERIAAAKADLTAAEANLELLRYQIEQGKLRAPADAVIRSRLREPGDMVTSQTPVYALALTGPKWVRVYVREADLGRLRPGLNAEVLSDSQPGAPYEGTVGYISSVAEFTPKAVQTEELRSSLVYEVHVTIEDPGDQLRLGQPVTVKLTLGATK